MAEDRERLRRYREYLDFYEGKQETGAGPATKKPKSYNYARAFVHKAASYLFGQPYALHVPPLGPGDEGRAAEVERLLTAEYERLDLHALDYDVAVDAAVLGDGAFKVTWETLTDTLAVTSVDPQALEVVHAPDDYRRLLGVRQSYELPVGTARDRFGLEIASADGREPTDGGNRDRDSVKVTEAWTAEELVIELEGTPARSLPNPIGQVPYVIFPNLRKPHSPWGESDLVDLVEINRQLNTRMSIFNRILEVSGNPIVVLENAEMEDVQVGPGETWTLPEHAKAYIIDMLAAGGAKLHLEYIELLFRIMYDLAETPRTAFGGTGRVVSGAALEIELEPLVQKINRKRRIWSGVIRHRNELMLLHLAAHGHADLVGYTTRVDWPSLLPADRGQLVTDEVKLVAAGIHSRRRAMEALGEDAPEEEWARVQDELRVTSDE